MEEVPRQKLEEETVLYCDTVAKRQPFQLLIDNGKLIHEQCKTSVNTGEEGWIVVVRDGILFGGKKKTETIPRVHHTSFVAGECVQAAGLLVAEDGVLSKIYPHSGHYRPSESELLVLLVYLQDHGVDLSKIQVDVQRVQKITREEKDGKALRKIQNPCFWDGLTVLSFLEVKNKAWKSFLFDELVQSNLLNKEGKETSKEGPF